LERRGDKNHGTGATENFQTKRGEAEVRKAQNTQRAWREVARLRLARWEKRKGTGGGRAEDNKKKGTAWAEPRPPKNKGRATRWARKRNCLLVNSQEFQGLGREESNLLGGMRNALAWQ